MKDYYPAESGRGRGGEGEGRRGGVTKETWSPLNGQHQSQRVEGSFWRLLGVLAILLS